MSNITFSKYLFGQAINWVILVFGAAFGVIALFIREFWVAGFALIILLVVIIGSYVSYKRRFK